MLRACLGAALLLIPASALAAEELSRNWTVLLPPSQRLGSRRGEVREFTSRTRGEPRPAPEDPSRRVHLWTRLEPSSEETALFDLLGVREQVLDTQTTAAQNTTRQRALLAYRLSRRRELDFAANPETRLDEARSFDLALVALRRSLDESRALARELDRVRVDRSTLEAALVTRALNENAGMERSTSPERSPGLARLLRPVRGTPVAVPGTRRDGTTKIEIHHDSLEILARLNEPVHAIAAGVVKRVEPMAQGGFAVMTAHPAGLTSILTGLRDVAVKPGDTVLAGQTLGLTGRNLDGAAVISVAIWRNRRPEDAAKLLRVRLAPTS